MLLEGNKLFVPEKTEPTVKIACYCFIGEYNMRETRVNEKGKQGKEDKKISKWCLTKLATVSQDDTADCSVTGDIYREVEWCLEPLCVRAVKWGGK